MVAGSTLEEQSMAEAYRLCAESRSSIPISPFHHCLRNLCSDKEAEDEVSTGEFPKRIFDIIPRGTP